MEGGGIVWYACALGDTVLFPSQRADVTPLSPMSRWDFHVYPCTPRSGSVLIYTTIYTENIYGALENELS